MITKGKVYLVGAGPGDPGLFTVKGVRCLEKADVVLYDYLVHKKLLNYVQEKADIIYVGKKAGNHTLEQEKINTLMIEKAKEGKIVVRLKGGDPFIFGRGAEEALELAKNNIPFEIIPGITAAIAVSAYAGIPLTYREFNSTLTFVTGHEDPFKEKSAIHWKELAATTGTLVIFMGVKNLAVIAKTLIEYGKSAETPVAVVYHGTFPDQKTVTGTLGNIALCAEKEKIKSPALVIIGEVVTLREKLNWYESLPLFGKKILITRSRRQAGKLSALLDEFGAETIEIPVIRIEPVDDYNALDIAIEQIHNYNWLIFTSVNGVHAFFERFLRKNDIRNLAGIKLASIGPATKKEIESFHLKVDFTPTEYVAECFTEEFIKHYEVKNKKFLLISSDKARDHIQRTFSLHGGDCTVIIGYKTVTSESNEEELNTKTKSQRIDWVTFTSSSTVKNFFKLYKGDKNFKIASIGPITSQTIRDSGFLPDVEAKEHTIPGLVNAILGFHGGKK